MAPCRIAVLLPLLLLNIRPSAGEHRVRLRPQSDGASSWSQPRIISSKGRRFTAAVNKTVLTSVVVSDLHGTARVTCDVLCAASAANNSCPFFKAGAGDANLFIGSVLFNASCPTVPLAPLLFNLSCADPVRPSRTAAVAFSVILVDNDTLAFQEPPVTKELVRLDAEAVRLETPSEVLSLARALTNVTESNQLTGVELALASGLTAAAAAAVRRQASSGVDVVQEVTNCVSSIMGNDVAVVGWSEAEVGAMSQLLRIAGSLTAAVQLGPSLGSNSTFASPHVAIGAARVDSGSERMQFGSAKGLTSEAAVSTDDTAGPLASISVRADAVAAGRVGFVMIDQNASWAAFYVGGKIVLSPMFSVSGQVRGGVLLTFPDTLPHIPFPIALHLLTDFLHCAAWDAQIHAWKRQGCRTTVTHKIITCNCSQHTNLALLVDQALDDLLLNFSILFFVLFFVLLDLALLFTFVSHCFYAYRKWVSSREREAGTVLAVERSWMTMIMCVILAMMGFNILIRWATDKLVGCLGRDAFTLACYLLFAAFTVLEGWQAFLSLVSRIVLRDLHTTNLGSVYRCFNKSWGLTVLAVGFFALILYYFSLFLPMVGGSSNNSAYGLCEKKPGLVIYLGFVLPLSLGFTANVAIAGLLTYAIVWRSAGLPPKQRSRFRMRTAGYVAGFITFNACAMFGLLSDGDSLLALYMFTGLYLLVEAVYFVFFFAIRAEIRKTVLKECPPMQHGLSCPHCCAKSAADSETQEGETQPLVRPVAAAPLPEC